MGLRPVSPSQMLAFFRAIATGPQADVIAELGRIPGLARAATPVGATRHDPETYFLAPLGHYVYEGDTALHVAAAAYQRELAEALIARGANVRARNRRGAEPLHYAADGSPDAEHWSPAAQRDTIAFLIANGADPNALDKSGVGPLHRAARTRCSDAVRALIDGGADPRLPNRRGSTPLDLAVQTTGRGGSGSPAAKDQQRRIIALLTQ